MKKIDFQGFRVHGGREVNLKKWPTLVKPVYESKKEYKSSCKSRSRS